MEVVDIKKILVPNLLIYIYLHCVSSSLWCATMLATLISKHKERISLNLGKTVLTVLPNSIQKESTIRFRDFRNLILLFYSLVFFRHFLRMLRLVVFSSKTKSYQEQKTREIAMAKPAKVISNKSCVELSLLSKCSYNMCIWV